MKHLWRILAKLSGMLSNQQREADLAREIASHLALLEDEYVRRGMNREGAAKAAREAYGSVEQAKQSHRDERTIQWLEQTFQDVRYATRALMRTPGFTLVAVITLALGIGLNTTLFSAYNAVALKPLPVPNAKTLVRMERWFKDRALGDIQYAFSYPEYVYCRDHQREFDNVIATTWPIRVLVTTDANNQQQAKAAFGQAASENYFTALGIHAAIGRTFVPQDAGGTGASPVLVLSDAFWQREFRRDPAVIGKTVTINGTVFTVIGVAPREFTGTSVIPQIPDFWTPLAMQPQLIPGQNWLTHPDNYRLQMLARLKNTSSWSAAQAEATGLIQQFSNTYASRNPTIKVTLQQTAFFGNTEDTRFEAGVAMLMVVVGMVLLVACANIANMLLARGAARQREISVRMALGATRARIVRHLLTENILLALMGGAGGVLLAVIASKVLWVEIRQMLTRLLGPEFVFRLDLSPDGRVLMYALVISVLTGIVFGLSPSLQFTRKDVSAGLKDEGSTLGVRVSRSMMRKVLIGMQVAVSMLLLTTAGLLVRGLVKAQSASPGFATQDLYLVRADFGDERAKASQRRARLAESLARLPEVQSTAIGTPPMLGTWTPPVVIKSSSAAGGEVHDRTLASRASSTYFETAGIELLRGRGFARQEADANAGVAVISEATAHRYWPGEDPLGRHLQLDENFDGKLTEFEVIGIARDVRFANLTRIDPAHVYIPSDKASGNELLMRTRGDRRAALASVQAAVEQSDSSLLPSLQLWNVDTMLVAPRRMMALALAGFAGVLALLALTLAGVGIYGVMAYIVSQRTQEIGIRMALGATGASVLRGIALPALWPVFIGITVGVACGGGVSWVLHGTLASPETNDFLYGVPFYDPWTFAGLTLFLVLIAFLASLIPGLRALKVDPVVALRCE